MDLHAGLNVFEVENLVGEVGQARSVVPSVRAHSFERLVLGGWRPKARSSQMQTLKWDIYVLTHEMGHATANQRGEDLWSERAANVYGRGPAFERVASRLGVGPYARRQLRSALQRVGLIYE